MCGICGIVDVSGRAVDPAAVRAMAGQLAHRGPDDEGFKQWPGTPYVSFGHRRLSILDLSSAGRQPMLSADAMAGIVFNGEIYNFRELREELEAQGERFHTGTDTEVLLRLYERDGEACVARLRGMFAFAIWDGRRRQLFAARDRLGKKPFVYAWRDGRFAFASELAGLAAGGVLPRRIRPAAVDEYFTFGYIPAPGTIYEDVWKLPPAHTLLLRDGQLTVRRYWDLAMAPKQRLGEAEAAAGLLERLEEAVRLRLRSDVPLGAFLSGGLDSSAIVALMSRQLGRPVQTFTIGFEERAYSELAYARRVARHVGSEHHEIIVRPRALEVLPLLVERYGEPFADSSAVPTYYVARETRKAVTVALNGDGGDELFAGYERYAAMDAAERLRRLPRVLQRAAFRASRCLPDAPERRDWRRQVRRFFDGAALPVGPRYARWVGLCSADLRRDLYGGALQPLQGVAASRLDTLLAPEHGTALVDRLVRADTLTYLPDDLLMKVDIASMANGLEARSPFLDHEVVEYAAGLPASLKLRGLTGKYLLRQAMRPLLPPETLSRRKMGFGVPLAVWFRGELRPLLEETVLSPRALDRGWLNPDTVRRLAQEHLDGRQDHSFPLWGLLMFELWHQRFME